MKPVRMYTTPICPYCVRAKSLLKRKGVEVEEVDVLMDLEARRHSPPARIGPGCDSHRRQIFFVYRCQ